MMNEILLVFWFLFTIAMCGLAAILQSRLRAERQKSQWLSDERQSLLRQLDELKAVNSSEDTELLNWYSDGLLKNSGKAYSVTVMAATGEVDLRTAIRSVKGKA